MAGVSMLGFDGVLDALDYDGFGTAQYRVGSDVRYSVYVEYGTSRMQAQPYLRPAVESAIADIDQYASEADDADELVELLADRIAEEARSNAPVDSGRLRDSISAEKV